MGEGCRRTPGVDTSVIPDWNQLREKTLEAWSKLEEERNPLGFRQRNTQPDSYYGCLKAETPAWSFRQRRALRSSETRLQDIGVPGSQALPAGLQPIGSVESSLRQAERYPD